MNQESNNHASLKSQVGELKRRQSEMHDLVHKRHQLIVVGNGFDLACGLKSKYFDFFGSRLERIDNITTYWRQPWCETVRNSDLTLWDFMLRMKRGSNWCKVEEVMGSWVLPPANGVDAKDTYVERTLQKIRHYPFADPNSDPVTCNGRLEDEQDDQEYMLSNVARFIWMEEGRKAAVHMDRAALLSLLWKELRKLERLFSAYLADQVAQTSTYFSDATALLTKLMDDELPWADKDGGDTSLLTFNYTQPFLHLDCGIEEDAIVNIHGNLQGEVVFGVDGTDCMGDLDALPFTKTYRVASMGAKMAKSLYDTATGGIGNSKTGAIKFFGHSLGEADYAYFQSIFDGINLYGGNTKLIFYYRPWQGVTEGEVRADMVRRVARLLSTYGKTLDNKDHGKNLMHKLLLEGRITVKLV